jgi:hypothetical protein
VYDFLERRDPQRFPGLPKEFLVSRRTHMEVVHDHRRLVDREKRRSRKKLKPNLPVTKHAFSTTGSYTADKKKMMLKGRSRKNRKCCKSE